MTTTANLQREKLTVAQAARLMNVSERSVYMVGELMATGRNDLLAELEAGRISILRALKIAKPDKYAKPRRATLRQLQTIFLTADESTRRQFLVWARQA